MPKVEFEFDPEFDDNVYRASNKTRSSLRGLYDMVRSKTDEIAADAKLRIESEQALAEQGIKAVLKEVYQGGDKAPFLEKKARSFALRAAANSLVPIMGFDGKEIYGRVIINRKGSISIEMGGADPVAEIGKSTGEYIVHPPYAFLRRSMERAGM